MSWEGSTPNLNEESILTWDDHLSPFSAFRLEPTRVSGAIGNVILGSQGLVVFGGQPQHRSIIPGFIQSLESTDMPLCCCLLDQHTTRILRITPLLLARSVH
jgi:hypothetical protein